MANFISDHLRQEVTKDINLLLRDLLKVIKVLTMYPPDNPLPARMRESIGSRMVELVARFDGLQFTVRADELVYLDQVVFTDKSREEALAALFYQAGIIQLDFAGNLARDEFDRFLDNVKTFINDRSPDRDLVSLLWQEQYAAIRFRTIEDVALGQYDAAMTVEEVRSNAHERRDFSSDIVYNDILLDDPAEAEPPAIAPNSLAAAEACRETGLSLVRPTDQPDPFLSLLQEGGVLSEDDQAEMRRLIAEDRFFDAARAAARIQLEIMQVWEDQQPLVESVTICEKILDELLAAGAFAVAADFLHSLHTLQAERRAAKPVFADRLTEFFRYAGDFKRIERLTEIINQQETVDTGSIELYLEALGWESLAHIIAMLGKLVSKAARLMVCDYLAHHGCQRIPIIGGAVRDRHWYVARNAVMILGRIGGDQVLPYLSGTVNHPHERVRAEAIRALAAIRTEAAVEILTGFLNDPDSELRLNCLKQLEKIGGRKPFERLWDIVQSPAFLGFSLEEQEWFLAALSRLGGEEVVSFLGAIVGAFQLFPNAATMRYRLAALTALVHNRSQDAEDLILRFTCSRRRWLQEAAVAALEQRRRQVFSGGDDRAVSTD